MPIDLREKFGKFSSDPRSQKAADGFKKLETGVWRALEPVGRVSNKLAAKVGAESFWPTELADGELDKAARILRTFTLDGAHADEGAQAEMSGGVSTTDHDKKKKQQKVIRKIPPKALQQACGVAIFTAFRTGFGWSGAGGSGVVLAKKPDGSWSAPSGILIHTVGWGAVIGLDVYDVVLVIRRPETLQAFTKPKLSVGGELSVAAGPVGNGAVIEAGADGKPVWSYVKSKGLYVGLQLDGTIMLKRDDANSRLYGRQVPVADIFAGAVSPPPAAQPLLQTLYAAEGRPQVMGTHAIPQGQTPGDLPVSEEEIKTYQAQAPEQQQQQQQQHLNETTALQDASGGSIGGSRYVAPDALPPAYAEAAPEYQPPVSNPVPRDAAAEKEALRAKYANEGATGNASNPQHPTRVEALYDFNGVEAGDLSFTAGQIIEVTGAEGDQWYRGRLTSSEGAITQGIFPANYVRTV